MNAEHKQAHDALLEIDALIGHYAKYEWRFPDMPNLGLLIQVARIVRTALTETPARTDA